MDLSVILSWVNGVPFLHTALVILGSLVVAGQAYVAATPTQSDDAWFASLEAIPILGSVLKALVAFAPIQRKQP